MAIEKDNWFERLRDLAEIVAAKTENEAASPKVSDFYSLLHEIKVYQAELEIQNEELRKAQTELSESRDRFFALFQNAPVGYVVLSKDGIVLEANRTASRMLQKDRQELLKKPFSSYINLEDRSLFFGRFRSLYKNPEGKIIEVRINSHDGSSFHARMEGKFIPILHDEKGKRSVKQFCLAITDITKTKEAENELRKSESEYRNLTNSLNDAIILADTNGKIILFNPSAEKLFKCTAQEAVGSSVSRFCPRELRVEQSEMIRQVVENGFVTPYHTERLTADGRPIPVEVSLSALPRNFGDVFLAR